MDLQIDTVSVELQQVVADARGTMVQSFWFIDKMRKAHFGSPRNIRLKDVMNSDHNLYFGVEFHVGQRDVRRVISQTSAFASIGLQRCKELVNAVLNSQIHRSPLQPRKEFLEIVEEADLDMKLMQAVRNRQIQASKNEAQIVRKRMLHRLQRGPAKVARRQAASDTSLAIDDDVMRSQKILNLAKFSSHVLCDKSLIFLLLPRRHDGKCFVDIDCFSMGDISRVILFGKHSLK